MSVSIKDWSHSQILPLASIITASISLGENIFQASCRDILYYFRMGLPLIFISGHSFIRRLHNFVAANPNINHQFLLNNVTTFKCHGVGGKTVAKTLQYDLPVVVSFAPGTCIVILQLRTNDLFRLDPLVVGSSIEELVTILDDTYNVENICVCQTLLAISFLTCVQCTYYTKPCLVASRFSYFADLICRIPLQSCFL